MKYIVCTVYIMYALSAFINAETVNRGGNSDGPALTRRSIGDTAEILRLLNQIVKPNRCPPGWSWFNQTDACYLLFKVTERFEDAVEMCAILGAHVTDISSSAENVFIKALHRLGDVKEHIWIGLTDIEDEWHWKWQHSGAMATYTNWKNTIPTKFDSHCVDVDFTGGWNNENCLSYNSYICKIRLQ